MTTLRIISEIVSHFESLGIELEQYATADELCEAMWEGLQEDGLDNDNDYDVYYACECAAGEMWEEHCNAMGLHAEDLQLEREAERELARRVSPPRDVRERKPRKPFIEPDPVVVPERHREPVKLVAPEAYVSEETRRLEKLLEASRARDVRRGELLTFLDTLSGEDCELLHSLIHERLHGED